MSTLTGSMAKTVSRQSQAVTTACRRAGTFTSQVFPLLLPFLGLVFVSLVAYLLYRRIIDPVADAFVGYYQPVVPEPPVDLRGRMSWAAALLVYAVMTTAVVAFAGRVLIDRLLDRRDRKVAICGIVIAAGIGAMLLAFSPIDQRFVLDGPLLDMTPFSDVSDVVRFQNRLTIAAIAVVAMAVGLLARAPDADSRSRGGPGRVRAMGHAVAQVRTMLYLSAGVLVAGVLGVYSLYTWAQASTMVPGIEADVDLSMAAPVSALAGLFYSAILAGIFGPALAMLRSHGRELAIDSCEDCRTERGLVDWMHENSVLPSLPGQLATVLAVFAPLLTGGPGAALLKFLGG